MLNLETRKQNKTKQTNKQQNGQEGRAEGISKVPWSRCLSGRRSQVPSCWSCDARSEVKSLNPKLKYTVNTSSLSSVSLSLKKSRGSTVTYTEETRRGDVACGFPKSDSRWKPSAFRAGCKLLGVGASRTLSGLSWVEQWGTAFGSLMRKRPGFVKHESPHLFNLGLAQERRKRREPETTF